MSNKKNILILIALFLLPFDIKADKLDVIAGLFTVGCAVGAGYCLHMVDTQNKNHDKNKDKVVLEEIKQQKSYYKKLTMLYGLGGALGISYLLKSKISSLCFAGLGLLGFGNAKVQEENFVKIVAKDSYKDCKEEKLEEKKDKLEEKEENRGLLGGFIEQSREKRLYSNIANINFDMLNRTLDGVLRQQSNFLRDNRIDKDLLNKSVSNTRDQAEQKITYIEKSVVNNIKIALIGDIHGSAPALAEDLYQLKNLGYFDIDFKIEDGKELIFIGDVADRGNFGIEAWYIIWLLMLKNPGKVRVVRGNHEEEIVAAEFGFWIEIYDKYSAGEALVITNKIKDFFAALPSALFIGKKGSMLQISHGGIPIDYQNNKYIDHAVFKEFLNNDQQAVKVVSDLIGSAIRWGDFGSGRSCDVSSRFEDIDDIWVYRVGIDLAKEICNDLGIKNILRGHAHNGSAVSVYNNSGRLIGLDDKITINIKDNFAYTFMSCPQGGELSDVCKQYGFGIVHINGNYENWTITSYIFI